jgi:hypothetical protein
MQQIVLFCAIIVALGLLIVIIFLIFIAGNNKRENNTLKLADIRKTELKKILIDAETKIEELNRFSEHVITRIEFKDEELRSNLRWFEEQMNSIKEKAMDYNELSDSSLDKIEQFTESRDNMIPVRNKYKEVARLAKEGFSEIEIAKRLNMGKGEIQMVLSLQKK